MERTMDLYDRFRQARSQVREANKKKIQGALNNIMPKTASLVFDLSQGEKGKKIDNNRRAHVKAVELVSSLLNSFSLPVRPMLSYRGMVKNAIDNTGVIEDGIIRIGATIQTLMGHKADIDIPVIVKNKSLIEPAVFLYQDAPYVMCGPALQEIVKRGTLQKQINPRRMYAPPMDHDVASDNLPRETIVNKEHMFSPGPRNPYNFRRQYNKTAVNQRTKENTDDPKFNQWLSIDQNKVAEKEPRKRTNIDVETVFPELWENDVPDECLDVAERSRDGLFEPGCRVKVNEDVQARDRGGGHIIVPKGEEGVVVKDTCGDGKMLAVKFPALQLTTALPKRYLKSAARKKVAQIGKPEYIDETLLNFNSGTIEAHSSEFGGALYEQNNWIDFKPNDRLAEKLNQEGWGVYYTADLIDAEPFVNWNKSANKSAAITADQIKNEVREMLREGYTTIDIKETVKRRYPQQAEEVLKGL